MQTLELSKEEELLQFCQYKKIFSSVDVRVWGIDNYYTRADRTARQFVEDHKFRRIPDKEAILRGLRKKGQSPIAWYEAVN